MFFKKLGGPLACDFSLGTQDKRLAEARKYAAKIKHQILAACPSQNFSPHRSIPATYQYLLRERPKCRDDHINHLGSGCTIVKVDCEEPFLWEHFDWLSSPVHPRQISDHKVS